MERHQGIGMCQNLTSDPLLQLVQREGFRLELSSVVPTNGPWMFKTLISGASRGWEWGFPTC